MKLFILACLSVVCCGQQIYNCPERWRTNGQRCYLFETFKADSYDDASKQCQSYGSGLVSVTTLQEHNFIIQVLQSNLVADQWYTSGIISEDDPSYVRWKGDGLLIDPSLQIWLSEADERLPGNRVIYKYGGNRFGLSRASYSLSLPYICEISRSEAYRILQEDRGFGYGTNFSDPNIAPRGPVFTIEPFSTILLNDAENGGFECVAFGIPQPSYRILRYYSPTNITEVTHVTDSRYTVTGGRLTISVPVEEIDSGVYYCEANNAMGLVRSNEVSLSFGGLGEFPNVARTPVEARDGQYAAIACEPPAYNPAVAYQWYKYDAMHNIDFVRPDLNPYLFISSNGYLYFSEVSSVDQADYHCIVKLVSDNGVSIDSQQPPSRISLAIPLKVSHAEPATWGPEIHDAFIAAFPAVPLTGKPIRLECFAYGTMPITYSWSREGLPMPAKVRYNDHNRVLELPEAEIEDSGHYTCHASRNNIASDQRTFYLQVGSKPFFIYPLPNQHVDIGATLTWRCEARAIPSPVYSWYKNGKLMTSFGEVQIQHNVMTISELNPTKHDGMYQCMAENVHGKTFSSAQLRVLGFRPNFIKHPLQSSLLGALGGNVTIECSPEAAPLPTFEWSRNRVPIGQDSRMSILGNGNLVITNLNSADQGMYMCLAANPYGSANSTGYLEITTSTVITRPPSPQRVDINTTGFIYCDASFHESSDYMYVWKFNGRVIDLDLDRRNHYEVISSGTNPGMYLKFAQYIHEGLYECVAQTTHDSDTASAYVTVVGPPAEVAGVRADQQTATSTAITVIWTKSSHRGFPIMYYIIEAKTGYNQTWRVVATEIPDIEAIPGSDRRMHRVEGLKPRNSYHFRVFAVNAKGIGSQSSQSTAYTTAEAAPVTIPSNVGGGGGSVGTLVISWTPLSDEEQAGSGIGYRVSWRQLGYEKWEEEVVHENVGSFTKTVGRDLFYTQYEVKVAAFNDHGPGPTSNTVTIYSAEDIPVGVPSDVYAYPLNATAIIVTWGMIPNNRDNMKGVIWGYNVNYWERFQTDPLAHTIGGRGQSNNDTCIGLLPYTWYTFEVQVFNTAGLGPRSEVAHARTYLDAPHLYPVEVHVFSHGSSSVRITWRGVSTLSIEESLQGYKLRYWATTEDARSASEVVADRRQNEAILYKIEKDKIYELRVLGYSRGGDGKHSQSSYFTLGGQVAFDPSTSEVLAGAVRTSYSAILVLIVTVVSTCVRFAV